MFSFDVCRMKKVRVERRNLPKMPYFYGASEKHTGRHIWMRLLLCWRRSCPGTLDGPPDALVTGNMFCMDHFLFKNTCKTFFSASSEAHLSRQVVFTLFQQFLKLLQFSVQLTVPENSVSGFEFSLGPRAQSHDCQFGPQKNQWSQKVI